MKDLFDAQYLYSINFQIVFEGNDLKIEPLILSADMYDLAEGNCPKIPPVSSS